MSSSEYATHFNTGISLRQLLVAGNTDEATLEFWVRSSFADNQWELSDLRTSSQAFSLRMHSDNQLRLSLAGSVQDIDLSEAVNGVVAPGIWHHVALTFQAGVIRIYVNGAKRFEQALSLTSTDPGTLFFRKAAGDNQEVAEIRAWSVKRDDAEISVSWLRSFNTSDATMLGDLEDQGIYALLGAYDHADNEVPMVLDRVLQLTWDNLFTTHPVVSKGVSGYNRSDGKHLLMEVRDDIEHPILANQTIHLVASKGVHPDKVTLTWNHIKGADSYVITKGASNIQVGSENAGSRAIGDPIVFDIDNDILPGEVTRYRVQAQGEVSSIGTDYGFVFHNGKISGKIQSSSGVGTPGVAMTFGNEDGLPGQALQFAAGDGPVTVNNADVFRQSGRSKDFLVEFWYRNRTNSASTNIPFRMGQVAIEMSGSVLRIRNGDGTVYLSHNSLPNDGQWHHYALAWTGSGGRIYQDGALVAENEATYSYSTIGTVSSFDLNAQANGPYELDEFRLWDASKIAVENVLNNTFRPETTTELNERLDEQAGRYWSYQIGGKEEQLLLYYRFDMEVPREVYNQAEATKGQYVGSSGDDLTRVASPSLPYAVYTDQAGNYIMEALNYGSDQVTLVIQPVKTNHTFAPVIKSEILQSSTNAGDYTKTGVDFTDESQFNVSGNVFYVADGTEYPVPAGQTFEFASGRTPNPVDYRPLTGGDGNNIETDGFGQYNLSLPIGFQNFRVANPLRNRSFGNQSLSFDGVDDYARSEGPFPEPAQGVTWSGWVKTGSFDGTTPEWQTLLQVGEIRLALRENTYLTLLRGANKLAEVTLSSPDDWQFFAFSFNQETGTILLYADESNQATSGIIGTEALSGLLYLGMSAELEDPFKGHLHLIEQRNTTYGDDTLLQLEGGKYIEGDEQVLGVSYHFAESDVSLRAVSSTPDSEDKALNLLNDVNDESTLPLYDATVVNPYTRQYRYEYEAQGTYANGPQQEWNVVEPYSGIDFYNLTRYGITGNIIIPCNNTLGVWDVQVERTDVTSPAFVKGYTESTPIKASDIFNSKGTVFTVGDLLPGIYKVTIVNQDDPSIEKVQFGVDLRQGWATVDFEYRSPLKVATSVVQVLGEDANKNPVWEPFDASLPDNYCTSTGNYVLNQQSQYQVRLEFFEEYAGNRCYVDDIEYYVAGDLQQTHGQLGTNIVGSSTASPFTSAVGIDTVLVWTNYPNFTGDYTRLLDVQVTNRDASTQLSAWVTGTLQDENQNFSLTFPNVTQVLYDPPGDGSSITWTAGSSTDYSTSWSHDHSFKAATKITTGTKHSAYMGAWVGLGGGAVVLYESSSGKVTAGGEVGTTHSIKKDYASTYSVSFDQAISTAGGTTLLPGPQSDVFIGTSDIIYFAPGKTLSVTGCQASYQEESNTGSTTKDAEFVYTRYGIENTLIPNLEGLIATLRAQLQDPEAENKNRETLAVPDQGKVDTIKNYLEDIKNWNSYLARTLETRQAVVDGNNATPFTMTNKAGSQSLPTENQALSGAVSQSFTIGQDESSSTKLSHSHNIDLTKYIKTGLTVFSVNFNLDITLNTKHEYSRSNGNGSSDREAFTIALSDDDPGDQFDVLFRQDPNFPTPIIVAKAGQSSCPVERHTVARQGVELAVINSTGWADLDEEAEFDIEIRDLNKANEEANAGLSRTYKLSVPSSRLPSGAAVRVEGLGNIAIPRAYTLEPGEAKSLKVFVKREDVADSPTEFIEIPLTVHAACDENLLELYGGEQVGTDPDGNPIYEKGVDKAAVIYNSDGSEYVRLRDVKPITAKFHEPCVGNLAMTAPVTNWVVNGTSDNQLQFRFKPETPHTTFSKVRFQFALENSDDIEFSKDVEVTELGTVDAEGYYSYSLNTEAIGADQVYRIRMVPVCGNETEGWQTNNPTDWIKGNIQRSLPVITATSPLNGSITTNVTASATFNRKLNTTTTNPLNISLRGILGGVSYEPKSAWFDQVSDQIEVPDQDILDLDSSYTIAFWVKPDKTHSSTVLTPLIEKGSNLQIAFTNGNYLYAGQSNVVSTQSIDTDGWTHVAVVYGKGISVNTLTIYLNGVRNKTVSAGIGNFLSNDQPLTIGKANGPEGFKGGIDEIRIWNKALSEATIRTNKDKRLIGTEDGLMAYYVLDDNALEPEAIRDFTALTSGSTASGIDFVTGADAAPMDIATVIQDIPLEVSTSADQTEVFIQPVASYPAELLEGALLTATIHDGRLRDEFGNPAAGSSWTFRVDKNFIDWNKGNHTEVQVAGNSESFDLTLHSENAAEVQYELIGLPMWLEATNPEPLVSGYYLLPSGNAHPMTFTTASWLSAGTYTGQVKAKVLQGATLLGIETVDIRVIVSCDDSHLQVTTNGYVMSARLTIETDGETYTDGIGKTVLVRNAAGTLVGKGTAQQVNEAAVVALNVYSDQANPVDPVCQVYLWNDAICQETPIGELTFVNGNTREKTLDLNYEGKAQYTVSLGEAGFYWLSFRATDADGGTTLSLNSLSGFENGDRIETHGMEAGMTSIYNGTGWSATLSLSVSGSYLVYVAGPRTIRVKGYAAKSDLAIALTANPGTSTDADNNAVGYLRNEAMTVSQAFSRMSTDATIGDLIISHQGNAQYVLVDGVGTWAGSLTHLIPNQGYKIKVANDATIRYSSTSARTAPHTVSGSTLAGPDLAVKGIARQLGLEVNAHRYAYATHLTGVLDAPEELLAVETDYLIVAMAGDEPRGVAIPQLIHGKWHYFLTAYGNQKGEALTFQWMARGQGDTYTIPDGISLEPSVLRGTVADPYVFRIGEEITDTGHGLQLYQNFPNPALDGKTEIRYYLPKEGQVELTLTNLSGQTVKKLVHQVQDAGYHSVSWDLHHEAGQLAADGVYLYTLRFGKEKLTKRVVIQ